MNFNYLGLKKLIVTSFSGSPVAGNEISLFDETAPKRGYKLVITEIKDVNKDGAIDLGDVEYMLKKKILKPVLLQGDGDFRSEECMKLLQEADIVVTNPPFSLFREYVAQLVQYRKKFLIIGNVNSITYKDIFALIKKNEIWLGASIHSGDREFRIPDDYPLNAAGQRTDEKGNKYIRVKGVRWWTNLDYVKRHEKLLLYKNYTPEEYPKYDNYDAINVDKTADIPMDYDGVMGVPITFLDKYNPEQFEIIGLAPERLAENESSLQIKRYINAIQHKSDGTTCGGNKVNDGPTLLYDKIPNKFPYYTSETVKGKYLEVLYARVLIRKK